MRGMLMSVAVSAALLGGAARPQAYVFPSTTENGTKTIVEVDNNGWQDAVVYVIQGLRAQRIGTVVGLHKERLTIPKDFVRGGVNGLKFAIHPIGSRRNQLSDEVSVAEGDTVSLFIPPF